MTDLLWDLARPPKPTFFRSWPTAVAPRWRVSTALAPSSSHVVRSVCATVACPHSMCVPLRTRDCGERPPAGTPIADEQGARPAMRDNASSPLALAASQVWANAPTPRQGHAGNVGGRAPTGRRGTAAHFRCAPPRSCCAVARNLPSRERGAASAKGCCRGLASLAVAKVTHYSPQGAEGDLQCGCGQPLS
jgi:hypothetical protein